MRKSFTKATPIDQKHTRFLFNLLNVRHHRQGPWAAYALLLLMLLAPAAHSGDQIASINRAFLAPANDIKADQALTIVYIIKAEEKDNDYWSRVRAGAEQAARDFGVTVRIKVPSTNYYDTAKQIALVRTLAEKKNFDGLIIAPIDTQALAQPIDKIIDGGIPVIVHDTLLNSDKVVTQLSVDNFDIAQQVGRWVNHQLQGKGKVLILEGQAESSNSAERRDGLLAGLADGEIEVMDMQSANWVKLNAYQLTMDWLKKYPDINAILAANDPMALGAVQALRETGRQDVLVTGIDGSKMALEAIANGQLHATVDQSPEAQARQAIQLMIRHILKGETFPDIAIWQESPLITIENIGQFYGHP